MLRLLIFATHFLKISYAFLSSEQERDLFLQNFQKYLVSGSSKLSADQPASSDFDATKVCRNLGKATFAVFCYLLVNISIMWHA
jgi:hypothetical protein